MEVILSFFSFFIVLFFFSDSHLSKCVSFLFFYQLTFLIGDFSNFHQTTKWEINSKLQSFKHMLHFSFSEIDVLFLGNSRAIRFSCESDLLVRHVSRMTALFINIVYIWFLTVATKTLNLIRLFWLAAYWILHKPILPSHRTQAIDIDCVNVCVSECNLDTN